MRLFRALGLVCWAFFLAFCLLVTRNEYGWMASEAPAERALPHDDAQGLKETLSIVGLAIVLALQSYLLATAKAARWRIVPAVCAVSAAMAWYFLFWRFFQ